MTELDLSGVLTRRFNVDAGRLNAIIGQADFPQRLFRELLGPEYANAVLVDIFNAYIVMQQTLCEAEKAIVREVRTWDNKSPSLDHICRCFYDSELVAA